MRTYPVYILDLDKILVVAPISKCDLDHPKFWETNVAKIVSDHYGFSASKILNAPYCQRRGRVVGRRVFYSGEMISESVMKIVRHTLKEPHLRLVFDEHHQRLAYDVAILNSACFDSQSN